MQFLLSGRYFDCCCSMMLIFFESLARIVGVDGIKNEIDQVYILQ